MFVIKIAPALNSNDPGTPSARSLELSVFQWIIRLVELSNAALRMFNDRSSNSTESQSSNTTTLPLSAYSYNLQYSPMADIAPLTTSYLGFFWPSVLNRSSFLSTLSTPNDLPTPGGPVTIIARTVPSLVAWVISSRMSNRLRRRSMICSSVSSAFFAALLGSISVNAFSSHLIRMFLVGKPAWYDPSTVM